MVDDLDLEGINPNAIDDLPKSGGLVPEGKYHVRLDGAGDTSSKTNGTQGTELTFVILTGAHAGQEVKETVWKSDNEKAKCRLVLFASRLGLLVRNTKTNKFERVKDKNTFQDCRGAEVVIEVVHREYEKKDKSKGKAANVSFGGIWSVDDKEVKDVPKAKAGSKPPPAAAPKKVDTSGI
jgi:hypothetical protein